MASQSLDGLLHRLQWPFDRLMDDLLSNSNTDRANAEEFLLHLSKNHPVLLCLKTSLLLCSPCSKMRFVSAILLRQFLTPTSAFYVWSRLSSFCQFYLRINLLLALEEEEIRHVANAKSDTIAQLASNFVPLHLHYPELLKFVLVRMAMRESPVLVEASLRIFAQIAKPLVHILEERVLILNLRTILSSCINYPTSSDVCSAALSALSSLLWSLPSSADRNKLQNVLVKGLSKIERIGVRKVLEVLIDLAETEPNFVRKLTEHTNIVLDMLAVAESSQFDEGTRHLALEFVITIAEARDLATVALCKMPLHGTRVLGIILEMLSDVDDMARLSAQLEVKETNQLGNYTLALESLDRLVSALGGNMLLKSTEDTLPAYMMDSNCKRRHAEPLVHLLEERVPTLRSILSTCINYATSSDVRVAALSALCSLLQSLPPSAGYNGLQNVLIKALTKIEITDVWRVLELLIDFAAAEPNFFHNFVIHQDFILDILAVAENSEFDEGTRHLALEYVITLAEGRKPAVTLLKMRLCVTKLFAMLLEMLLGVGDDMVWLSAQPEGKVTDPSSNYTVALECLDRLTFALGGNVILEAAEDILPAYLIDSDCKRRHAALIALARISLDCCTKMELGDVYNDKVLTALVEAMNDFENPCMQVSSLTALQNFIEKCNDKILISHLDEIVRRLVTLLKLGKPMVQEGTVSALTTVAEAVGARGANLFDDGQLSKYYDAVMPHLTQILMNATKKTYLSIDKTHRILLAKSADCVSLVGHSVGRDKFREHAQVVMDVLISLHKTLNPQDPATYYILHATATMCQALKHDFLPYVDTLVKTLLRKRIHLRTSILEEKAAACNNLLIYVGVLKEHFSPWAKKVAFVLAPHIKSNYHVEVKRASAKAMPELLKSAKLAIDKGIYQNHDAVKQMFAFMLPKFLDGIHKEHDLETCAVCLYSLNQCLELSARLLEAYQVRNIVDEIKHLITSSDVRTGKRGKMKAESYHGEEELINKKSSYEDLIFFHIGKCLFILFDTQQAAFLPFFDELSMYITPMMAPKEAIHKRRFSLLTFVDVIRRCGNDALRYHATCLPYLLLACNDRDNVIRENGLYGVAVCAIYGGSGFNPHVSEALTKINNVIRTRDALGPDVTISYLYAVLALGSICKFHKFQTRAEAIATWLNCLPIRRYGLAMAIHEQLCSMVESSDRQLLGENNENLTKIISIFSEILSSHEFVATEQTRNRMVNFLKGLEVENSSIYSSSTLSCEVRLQLQAILKWP